MDIYRFFHPHHNPRLLNTPLRHQEISELEQVSHELLKALERAQQRCARRGPAPIMPQHFTDMIKAVSFVSASLQMIAEAHPGDSREEVLELVEERNQYGGWQAWASLVREHLGSFPNNP